MNRRAEVERVLAQTMKSLDGLERPALMQLMPVLHAAQEEVRRDLTAWLRSNHGGDTFTAQRYRNALAALNAAIDAGGDAEGKAVVALKGAGKLAAHLSVANVRREWQAFGHIFEGTVQPLPIDEAAVLARGDKLLWPKYESSAAKYAGRIGDGAKRQLAISRARGETIDELTNRLFKHMPSVFRGERSDAERLAITETHNAYRQVHHDAIISAIDEDPLLMERWEGSHDGRRCLLCARLDGQVVKPGEPFRMDGLVIHDGEGAHPRCRCGRVPWRETWPIFANRTSEATIAQSERRAAWNKRVAWKILKAWSIGNARKGA